MQNAFDFLAVRKLLDGDYHRPHYHYVPPSNWMNDPNGLIQWQGEFHLFYQYNPNGPLHGTIHWGHALSTDLIHWDDLPIALSPTPGSADEAGCFSGCAINNAGTPTLVYTGTRGTRNEIQTQCLATSDDQLLTWHKYPKNPVLSIVPAQAGQTHDFRDPFVWKDGDSWFMVVGSRIKDVGGVVFLYRSPNLIDWEYLGPLLIGNIERNGVIWECPNFFKLGDSWVLIISAHTGSVTGDVIYFVGSYENYRFIPEYEGVLDYGVLYAPLTFTDEQGRRLLFGWLRESRSKEEQQRAGWSGVQSIPRVLALDARKRLTLAPASELERLRGTQHHYGPIDLSHAVTLDVTGRALDIVGEFTLSSSGICGLSVACSSDGKQRTEIAYVADSRQLSVRTITDESTNAVGDDVRTAPHVLSDGESLKLRVLLDASVIEIIANDRTSLSSRIYPSQAEHNFVQVFGTEACLDSLNVWQMQSIWP